VFTVEHLHKLREGVCDDEASGAVVNYACHAQDAAHHGQVPVLCVATW
jgi:hypothetical protein